MRGDVVLTAPLQCTSRRNFHAIGRVMLQDSSSAPQLCFVLSITQRGQQSKADSQLTTETRLSSGSAEQRPLHAHHDDRRHSGGPQYPEGNMASGFAVVFGRADCKDTQQQFKELEKSQQVCDTFIAEK